MASTAPHVNEAADTYMIHGRPVALPCVVRDAKSASVVYMVPARVAQRFVGDAYEVVEMAPGLTQLVLGFVDYRDNDLGDYDEVMVVFTVRPRGAAAGTEGTFIYQLPVNQAFTCEAGSKIWGFPKSVQQIEIAYTAEHVTCTLSMDGEHAFTLRVPRGPADAGEALEMAMTTYTYHDGPAALQFTTGGGGTTVTPGGAGVELTLGTHRLAGDLRALGLPATPLVHTWMEHMRGAFGAPRKL